jgi:carbamoyltransferase
VNPGASNIVGVSPLPHDSSAALVRDGVVVAAIENDKLVRMRTQGMPDAAIELCLRQGQISSSDLDCVAIANRPALTWVQRVLDRVGIAKQSSPSHAGLNGTSRNSSLELSPAHGGKAKRTILVDHHLCHAASAFFQSPFERALVVVMDEGGDGRSGLLAIGEGNQLRVLQTLAFPNSPAWVYLQTTALLGFVPRSEEHKTQWLGMEGEPAFKNVFLDVLRRPGSVLPRVDSSYFTRGQQYSVFSDKFYRCIGLLNRATEHRPTELSETMRRILAASLQDACVEVVGDLTASLLKREGLDSVCFAGGLFNNTLLVGSLEKRFGLGRVFVPPAPGNAGCSVGAALYVTHQEMKQPRSQAATDVYWGPSYTRSAVKDILDNCKARYSLQITEDKKIDATVDLLLAGKIVGWFQGAAEFGSRALGHRSIVASPWASYVMENVNDYIKHREWFRPFALVVAEEDCERYFECSALCGAMNSIAWTRKDANVLPERFILPGGRVRLQVVKREQNPLFWRLLKRFSEHAPAPILMNTSFNLFGEPLVVAPRDAVRSYFSSGLDALVIDNFVLSKSSASHLIAASRGYGSVRPQAPDHELATERKGALTD